MTEIFTILLVEDRPRTMNAHVRAIKEYIESLGYQPIVIIDETGDSVANHIQDNDVDIIVTDMNIGGGQGGIEIVKQIRSSGSLIDVLFYSAVAYNPEEIRKQIHHYAFVDFKTRDEVGDALRALIDRCFARLKDIVFLRGIVISRIIELELTLNEIIASYFQVPEQRICNFHDFVMENRYNSLEGKIQTFVKILTDQGIMIFEGGKPVYKDDKFENLVEKLRNLQLNRNILAHCKRDGNDPNCLMAMGTQEIFNKSRLCMILKNAKKASNQLEALLVEVKSRSSGPAS